MAQQNSTEVPQFVFFTNNSGAVVVNLNELVFVKNVKNGSALHFRDASELLVTETAEDVQEILQRIFGNRPEFRANENTARPSDRSTERGNERNERSGESRYENSREYRGNDRGSDSRSGRGRRFHKNTDAFNEGGFADDF